MQRFLQATAYGLLQGGLFAIVAVGFSLVWGVTNIVNLAHGALVIIGAYVAWQLHSALGLDPTLGMLPAAAILFASGYVIQRGLVNRVVNAPIWMTLLVTFGLELLLVNLLLVGYTGNYRRIRTGWASRALDIGGVRLPYGRLAGFGFAILLTVLLVLFITRTRTGLAIRAAGMDRGMARSMGVNIRHVYAVTFGIAAALAGAAGSIVGMTSTFSPADAGHFTLQSFVIAVLGGLGNMWGALAGGLLVGVVESLGAQYVSGTLINAFAFGLLVLVLAIRPSGLLGRPFYEARVET